MYYIDNTGWRKKYHPIGRRYYFYKLWFIKLFFYSSVYSVENVGKRYARTDDFGKLYCIFGPQYVE